VPETERRKEPHFRELCWEENLEGDHAGTCFFKRKNKRCLRRGEEDDSGELK